MRELSKRTGRPRSTLHFWITRGWLQVSVVPAINEHGFVYMATLGAYEAALAQARVARTQPKGPRKKRLDTVAQPSDNMPEV
jgi:hypothetical protein